MVIPDTDIVNCRSQENKKTKLKRKTHTQKQKKTIHTCTHTLKHSLTLITLAQKQVRKRLPTGNKHPAMNATALSDPPLWSLAALARVVWQSNST